MFEFYFFKSHKVHCGEIKIFDLMAIVWNLRLKILLFNGKFYKQNVAIVDVVKSLNMLKKLDAEKYFSKKN